MNKAEDLSVEMWCEETQKEYFSEGWSDSEMQEFAEAYHQSRVKSKLATYNNSFVSPSRQAIEREIIDNSIL